MTFLRWKIIMLIAALTIFAATMGVFAPTLVNLYLQYSREPTAPAFIRNHPYQLPVLGIIVIIVAVGSFLIYAAIRDNRNKKKHKDDTGILRERLGFIEKRLDSIERGKLK